MNESLKERVMSDSLLVIEGLTALHKVHSSSPINAQGLQKELSAWRYLEIQIGLDGVAARLREMAAAADRKGIVLVGCSRLRCPLHEVHSGVRGMILACCGCTKVSLARLNRKPRALILAYKSA